MGDPPWSLTADQFFEWVAYWRAEPFGDEWRQTAQIAFMQSLSVRWKAGQSPTFDDFMPVKQPKPKQSPQQLRMAFDVFFGQQKQLAQQRR